MYVLSKSEWGLSESETTLVFADMRTVSCDTMNNFHYGWKDIVFYGWFALADDKCCMQNVSCSYNMLQSIVE